MSARLESLWDEVLFMLNTMDMSIETREMDGVDVVLVDNKTDEEIKIA